MKRIIPGLILLILVSTSCKKDKKTDVEKNNASNATVSSLLPAQVTAGTMVTITGTNFGTLTANVTVLFDGVPANVQSVTPAEIKAVVPLTKSGELTVVIGDKTIKGLTYSYTPIGMITYVQPASGSAGAIVQIIGAGLGTLGPVKVTFNGVDAEVIGTSVNGISVKVPVATTGNIVVSSGNMAVQGPVFTVVGRATISDISPKEASSGTVVTLTGTNFGTTTLGCRFYSMENPVPLTPYHPLKSKRPYRLRLREMYL